MKQKTRPDPARSVLAFVTDPILGPSNMWKDEFLKLMSGTTIDLEQIERAQILKEQNIPSSLYKFRAINEYSLQNLLSDTVWVCSASNYNDPYDCALTLNTQLLRAATGRVQFDSIVENSSLEKHLTPGMLKEAKNAEDPLGLISCELLKQEPSIKEEDHEYIMEALKSVMEDVGDDLIKSFNDYSQRGMKVCSFSERNDSIVMWGHYANSHTGFCIEYPIDVLGPNDPRRRALFPVTYSSELFDATPYFLQYIESHDFNNLFGLISGSRKAPDWSYEEEWRLLLPMGDSFDDRDYLMPKPAAIYLGTRISVEDEKKVREIAESKSIEIKKMKLSQREFKLVPGDK